VAHRKPHRESEERGTAGDEIDAARRNVKHRGERREQQRRHPDIALEDQDGHRSRPADEERAQIFCISTK
jgi:hypothetical protein